MDREAWQTIPHGVESARHYLVIKNYPHQIEFGASQVAPSGKESICICRRIKRHRSDSWVGMISWRRAWRHTPIILLPGESHGQRSLVVYSP